jgi:hypothetical protein
MPEATKTCQVKMNDGKPCGRELYYEDCCIFHSKKEDKDIKLFQEKLDKVIKDESLEEYDFLGFLFPQGIRFPRHFDKLTWFFGAVFEGRPDFYGSTDSRAAVHRGTNR